MSTVDTASMQKINNVDISKGVSRQNPVSSSNAVPDSQDQNLDMVRNILFGEQVRENEKRQAALERFVRVSVNAWSEDTQRKFDTLAREIQVLKDLLQDETKARRDDTLGAKNRLDELGRNLLEMDKRHQAHQGESQEQWQKQLLKLETNVEQARNEMQTQFNQVIAQLRQDKPDRKALALLLQGMAKQLHDGGGLDKDIE